MDSRSPGRISSGCECEGRSARTSCGLVPRTAMRSQALSSAEGRKGYSEATAGFMQSGTTAIKVSVGHSFFLPVSSSYSYSHLVSSKSRTCSPQGSDTYYKPRDFACERLALTPDRAGAGAGLRSGPMGPPFPLCRAGSCAVDHQLRAHRVQRGASARAARVCQSGGGDQRRAAS